MTSENIVPIEPDAALEQYLSHRENEDVSDSTLQAHNYRLSHFTRWCEEEDIDSMADLSARDVQDFRHWRKQDGDLNNVSWHTQMATFRVFLKWAEDYQAVLPGFHERVNVPDLEPDEDARDETFSAERASDILGYLEQFHYASKKHTLFALLWHTGIRIGAAHSLDITDFHSDEGYIELRHRPETGTALKNKKKGERPISLASPEARLLTDYSEKVRRSTTDDHGRQPLFTTKHGRANQGTMRNWVYQLSRPCVYNGGDCPHGKDPGDCEATQRHDAASKCPSSFSPHTIRRSSITHWLSEDVPKEAVSDRMNVNEKALDKHYDKRSEKGKMEQRGHYFE